MNPNILQKKLQAGEEVYILDDFEESAIRLVLENGKTNAFIKHKGSRNEKEISQSNETVCEIILGGIEIPKSEYDMY